jgi:hypothetical protein
MISVLNKNEIRKNMYYTISKEIRDALAEGNIERCKALGEKLKEVTHA